MGEKRQAIFRNCAPAAPYTQIPNALLRDRRLKGDALGLLVRILSLPRDWDITIPWMLKQNWGGRDQIYRLLNVLREEGYCRRKSDRASGRWDRVRYEFTDTPRQFANEAELHVPLPGIPDAVIPEAELPDAETPLPVKPDAREKKYRGTKKYSPPTPAGGLRERGFEQVVRELRTAHPLCINAIDHLVEPLLRQRKLHGCPDPVFALGEIVRKAAALDAAALTDAVELIKSSRAFSFKVADVDTVLKGAMSAAARAPAAGGEPATEATRTLREALRRELGQHVFEAWFAAIEVGSIETDSVSVAVRDEFTSRYIQQHFEPTLSKCVSTVFGIRAVRIVGRRVGNGEAESSLGPDLQARMLPSLAASEEDL